jgi:hypothetical protein
MDYGRSMREVGRKVIRYQPELFEAASRSSTISNWEWFLTPLSFAVQNHKFPG